MDYDGDSEIGKKVDKFFRLNAWLRRMTMPFSYIAFGLHHLVMGLKHFPIITTQGIETNAYRIFQNIYNFWIMGVGQIAGAIPLAFAPILEIYGERDETKKKEALIKKYHVEEKIQSLVQFQEVLKNKFKQVFAKVKADLKNKYKNLSEEQLSERAREATLKIMKKTKEVMLFEVSHENLKALLKKIEIESTGVSSKIRKFIRCVSIFENDIIIKINMFLGDFFGANDSDLTSLTLKKLSENGQSFGMNKNTWNAMKGAYSGFNDWKRWRMPALGVTALATTGFSIAREVPSLNKKLDRFATVMNYVDQYGWIAGSLG